jgi:hypothetical protein
LTLSDEIRPPPTLGTSDKKNDESYLLCVGTVLVYSLNENTWYHVAVSNLNEAQWNTRAWSDMVNTQSQLRLTHQLQKLAEGHQIDKPHGEKGIDNLQGKGKGLIALLHGPPGVGKTMTAECLAEVQKRPLYRVNLGDLTNDTNWESTIEEIFRQAHLWDAILLIDEAEVLLAERTQENMQQSAWVAGE